MDRHRRVEVGLARAEFQRDREALQDFVGAFAEQVDADHALVFANADQLEQAALRGVGQCMQHRAEVGAIHANRIAELRARALASVRPTWPNGDCANTTVGIAS